MPVRPFCFCLLKVWAKTFLYLNLKYLRSQILDLHGSSPMVRRRRRTKYFWKSKQDHVHDVHVCPLTSEDFSGWTTSTEVLPYDTSGVPAGAVICQLPQYRWGWRMVGGFSPNMEKIMAVFQRDGIRSVLSSQLVLHGAARGPKGRGIVGKTAGSFPAWNTNPRLVNQKALSLHALCVCLCACSCHRLSARSKPSWWKHLSVRYEESQLHASIYQLQVKLLAADRSTVISEFTSSPTEDRSRYSRAWKEVSGVPISPWQCSAGPVDLKLCGSVCVCLQVSHMFRSYGAGVRYVHFLHRLKNMFLNGFYKTMFTNSTVIVRPSKTGS